MSVVCRVLKPRGLLLREAEGYVEQEKARLRGKAVTTSDGAKAPKP